MNSNSKVKNRKNGDNPVIGINNSIRYTRWFLRFLGLWRFVIDKPKKIDKIFSLFALPFSSFSMIILVIPIITHGIVNRQQNVDILALLDALTFQTANIAKHFVMILRSRRIRHCIHHMENDWRIIDENEKFRDIMMKNLRVGNFLTIVCTAFMYSGAVLYNAIMPIMSGNTINKLNETVRPLAYPGSDHFIDLHSGYNYEIVFFCNFVSGFFHFSVVITVCNLAAVFVSHACGQIQIVIAQLESLVDENADGDSIGHNIIENRIASIIQYHVRVLRFSSKIDEILREICLIEIGASTVILCILEYDCMMKWENHDLVGVLTYIVLLIAESFMIYILCHISELLKDQFTEVGKAAYLIEWYRLPGKTGLGLVLIIAMSNYPRKLTAGGMMELTIANFGNIIKTSMGYLNMIRAVAM